VQSSTKVNVEESDRDNENSLAAQEDDKDIHLVRQWVEEGKRPIFSNVSQNGYVIKTLWKQFERLSTRDGFLVRRCVLLPSNRETF
jgi:hypothetical protein